jgi:lipopolysaccharide transport system ATP-binding protein
VDEVLAVGDAEFQKKCLGRMKDVSENNGRTVLFVSHNLNSVSELCGSAIVLENGTITFNGSVNDSIAFYCNSEFKLAKFSDYIRINEPSKELFIKNAFFFGSNSMSSKYLFHADEFIGLRINVNKQSTIKGAYLHLVIEDERGNCLVETDSFEHGTNYLDIKDTGEIIISFKFPQRVFKTGKYWVSVSIASHQASKFQVDSLSHFIGFEVVADKFNRDLSRIALTSVIPEVSSELVSHNLKSQY